MVMKNKWYARNRSGIKCTPMHLSGYAIQINLSSPPSLKINIYAHVLNSTICFKAKKKEEITEIK